MINDLIHKNIYWLSDGVMQLLSVSVQKNNGNILKIENIF